MTTAPASAPAAAGGGSGNNSSSSSSSNHHRKMRRSREAAAPSDDSSVLSGFDLYSLQGDAAGALGLFAAAAAAAAEEESDIVTGGGRSGRGSSNAAGGSKSPSFVRRYNQLILSSLVAAPWSASASSSETQPHRLDDDNGLLNEMMRMDDEFRISSGSSMNSSISPRKKRRNELIMAFNRALLAFATGRREEAEGTCQDVLRELVPPTGNGKPPDEYAMVSSRIAFLWLECQLARSVGRAATMPSSGGNLIARQAPTLESVVNWLEAFDSERDPQLKFLLNLYRSRIDLAALDGAGRHDDARIRSARKELKQAMDVFQHRLRPTYGADSAGSVVSSANSEENTYNSASGTGTAAPANANATPVESQQPAPGSVVLQRHNQSALSLKANSEQLKGNTKKSLILCGEAHAAVSTSNSNADGGSGGDGDASYEVLHENNLAIIYETIGKRHLALHALTKALRASASGSAGGPPPAFFPDGTARPDPTLMVLHNAAICALQARNYRMAYRCMAVCVARSEVFHGSPRCWLRLAEACVGIFADDRNCRKSQGQGQGQLLFTPVQVRGELKGIVVDNALFGDHPKLMIEAPEPLASPEDFEQVERNPLVRARASLERVLQSKDPVGSFVLSSARLTLSYVHLAFEDYRSALEMAKLVLISPEPADKNVDDVTRRCHKRRVATARMYAAESSCTLGAPMDAMKFLVGDGHDDAFDRLASDLGGVTIETAATNGKGKRRLARAQTAVRSCASAVTADLGNLTAAKQLAMSAQAMEDAYESNRERSLSRRALAYALLKSGNHGAALSLLRSLR